MKNITECGLVAPIIVIVLSGCGSSPAQGPDNPAQAQAIQKHLADNFGSPSMTTSWYPDIGTVSVKGDAVIVQTDLPSNGEKAKSICSGTSSYVFSNDNASAGLQNVQILGANGEVLIVRQGIADSCSNPRPSPRRAARTKAFRLFASKVEHKARIAA